MAKKIKIKKGKRRYNRRTYAPPPLKGLAQPKAPPLPTLSNQVHINFYGQLPLSYSEALDKLALDRGFRPNIPDPITYNEEETQTEPQAEPEQPEVPTQSEKEKIREKRIKKTKGFEEFMEGLPTPQQYTRRNRSAFTPIQENPRYFSPTSELPMAEAKVSETMPIQRAKPIVPLKRSEKEHFTQNLHIDEPLYPENKQVRRDIWRNELTPETYGFLKEIYGSPAEEEETK